MALDWSDLPALFPAFPDPERWLPLLRRHAALLAEAAEHTRVSAVGAADVVQRQYAESLEILRITQTGRPPGGTLVDVGSGGGFPGLVIAAVSPAVEVHLVEPLQKRARLLSRCASELGLGNLTVHAVRAEDAGRGPLRDAANAVTARAVAELRLVLEYTAPLTATGGLIALPKGSGTQAELAGAAHALRALHCEATAIVAMRPEISTTLVVALLRKLAPTPPGYPRRAGVAAKRPI